MPSNVDTTALLMEQRKQNILWEQAPPGSRQENEAAEAATRTAAELDAALCDGAPLPIPWQRAQYPEDEVTVVLSSPEVPEIAPQIREVFDDVMTQCPACGMELADPGHTLADPACQRALGARLENRKRPS